MASPEETLADLDRRWERERQRGRDHYLFRNTVIQGVLPGVVSVAILMFVEPHVGSVNIGSGPWPLVSLLLFAIGGFFLSFGWWRRGERVFHERRSRHGSY